MPYVRPGAGVHTTNTTGAAINNGQPCRIGSPGIVGVAVKQLAGHWYDGVTSPGSSLPLTISGTPVQEAFFLITKGVQQVPAYTPTPAQGDAVYITATHVLTTTASGNTKFGRTLEAAGTRGTPTGKVRIDLDGKDSF